MMNKYEAMVIVRADISDDDRKAAFQQVNDAIAKQKGEISQSGVWSERRKLCFPIKKQPEGVYYLVQFSAPSAAVRELENIYRLNEQLLRVLITRVDKD
jgi:small subunit ribosomal protein S6